MRRIVFLLLLFVYIGVQYARAQYTGELNSGIDQNNGVDLFDAGVVDLNLSAANSLSGDEEMIENNSISGGDLGIVSGNQTIESFLDGNKPIPEMVYIQPKAGDIEIVEVFPSSGNCLDEFVKIKSHREYHGLLSIYGLGSSSSSVTIIVDLQSGSEVIITDNIAGILPSNPIMLVSSVTLTNAGEQLKLLINGEEIDNIRYSNLHGTQSLVYTAMSGNVRLFTTNITGTPSTTCGTIHTSSQLPNLSGLGLCDIKLSDIQYLGTGQYYIVARIQGLFSGSCNEGSERFLNEKESGIGCNVAFQTSYGLNNVEYIYSSGGALLCRDQFMIMTNYDIGYVKQMVGGQCLNTKSIATNIYSSSDCGIRFQGSSLGFFSDYKVNIISNIDNHDITNGNHKYRCLIDMGNGTIFQECNPAGFEFDAPGVYPVILEIRDNLNGQLVCKTRSFINAPQKTIKSLDYYKYFFELQSKLQELCQTVSDNGEGLELQPYKIDICNSDFLRKGVLNPISTEPNNTSYLTGVSYSGLLLYSLLPNPKGSDNELEVISLFNTGSGWVDLEEIIIEVGKKKIKGSGFIGPNAVLSMTGGWGLRNNGMCVNLYHKEKLLDVLCYDKLKESERVVASGFTSNRAFIQVGLATDPFVVKELSCTEKIKLSKQKDQEKYKKLQLVRKVDQRKYMSQIDKLKTKENIARNNRRLYENTSNLLFSSIKSQWPVIWYEGGFSSYELLSSELEMKITSGFIYTSKYKDDVGNHYKYTNAIKNTVKERREESLADIFMPGLSDYLQYIYEYNINQQTISAVKRL